MPEMREAVIVDAVRTPFGTANKERGFLREVRSDDMGVAVLEEIVRRTGVDPAEVDEVILGAVEQLGEQAHPGRNCAVLAKFPYEVPGLSVERACVTAMSSVQVAALSVMAGMGDTYIAGGIDSMTHIALPVVTPDTDFDALLKEENTMLSAMNPNPRMYGELNPLELVGGITAEKLAREYSITREEMDRWAVMSNLRAVEAQKGGLFKEEIVPIPALDIEGKEFMLDYDQGPRASSTYEKVSTLPTPFMPKGGTITAAAASGASDGAAVCMVMSKEKAREKGLKPFATIRGMGVAGCDPTIMGYSVVPATRKALKMLGMEIGEIELIEINEAFACVPIVFMKEFGIKSPDVINVNGGACAIGHPVGATGARLIGTLAYEMGRRGQRWGLATICGGYGQGGTTILEREDYDWGEYRNPEPRQEETKTMAVSSPKEFMDTVLIQKLSDPEKLKGLHITLQFDISGDQGGKWALTIKDQKAELSEGTIENPKITLKMKDVDYVKLVNNELSGQKAFMSGKLKFKGDMNAGMKLQKIGII